MTHAEILSGLTEIFHEVFDDDSIVLTENTTAADIPAWDSLNHITLIVEVERRFGLKVKTAEIEELHNVGDLVKLIAAKG